MIFKKNLTLRWFCIILVMLPLVVSCKKKVQPIPPEVGAITVPPEIIGFGGIRSQEHFIQALTNIVQGFAPQMAAIATAQFNESIRTMLGVKNISWIDQKRPIKFVLVNFKQYKDEPIIFLFPYQEKKQVVEAFPDNKKSGGENEITYTNLNNETIYANFLDDYVAFSQMPDMFAYAKGFITGPFAGYEFKELIDMQFSIVNLRAIGRKEIEEAKDELARMLTEDKGDRPVIKGLDELLKKEIELVLGLIDQMEFLRFVLRYDGNDIVLKTSIKAMDGTNLAKFGEDSVKRKLGLYKNLPSGGWLVGASNIDSKLFEGLAKLGLDFWAEIFKLDDNEKSKLNNLVNTSNRLFTGEGAFYVGRAGSFPFRVVSITSVEDGKKAKEATYEIYKLIFGKIGQFVRLNTEEEIRKHERALSMLKGQEEGRPLQVDEDEVKKAKEILDKIGKIDFTDPKALIKGIQEITSPYGLSINTRSEKVQDLEIDGVEVSFEYSKLGKFSEEEFQELHRIIGEKISAAWGFGDKRAIIALGLDAFTDIKNVGMGGEGNAYIDGVMKQLDTNPAMVIYCSLKELIQTIAQFVPQSKALGEQFSNITQDVGIWFALGGRQGNKIDAMFSIPLSKIAVIIKGVGGI